MRAFKTLALIGGALLIAANVAAGQQGVWRQVLGPENQQEIMARIERDEAEEATPEFKAWNGADRKTLFAWFDKLGYEAIKTGQFVRVRGFVRYWKLDWTEDDPIYGFLVHQDASGFEILTTHLEMRRYPGTLNTSMGNACEEKGAFEPTDIKEWVSQDYDDFVRNDKEDRFYGLDQRGIDFVVARACAARGLSEACDKFFGFSRQDQGINEMPGSYPEELRFCLARNAYNDLLAEYHGGELTRAQFADRLSWLAKGFPHTDYVEFAKAQVPEVREMIAQDAAHVTKALGQLDQKARIAELIYELRDQAGSQNSVPGAPDPSFDPRGDSSPYGILKKEHLAAVPQLIDALRENYPSRTLGLGRFGSPNYLMPVGQMCMNLLCEIAHENFFWHSYGNMAEPEKDSLGRVKKWWAEVQAKGERDLLIEEVEAGGPNAEDQARALAKIDPNAAETAISIGIEKEPNGYQRGELRKMLTNLDTPAGHTRALEEMRIPGMEADQINGAKAVMAFDPKTAIDFMIGMARSEFSGKTDADHEDLLDFLANCGDPRAMSVVGDCLPSCSVGTRVSLLSGPGYQARHPGGGIVPFKVLRRTPAEVQANIDAAERILAAGLLDNSVTEYGYYGADFNPSPANEASRGLSDLYPDLYHFRELNSPFEREVQRIQNLNVWRVKQRQPLLSVPTRPPLQAIPTTTLLALAQAAASGSASALSRLEAFGPSAILSLMKLGPGPDQKAFEALAKRLASRISDVRVNPSVTDPALRSKLEKLKGRFFGPATFQDLTSEISKSWPTRSFLALAAVRDTDGLGFAISASVVTSEENSDFGYDWFVQTGNAWPNGQNGRTAGQGSLREIADYSESITHSLKSDPFMAIRVSLKIAKGVASSQIKTP